MKRDVAGRRGTSRDVAARDVAARDVAARDVGWRPVGRPVGRRGTARDVSRDVSWDVPRRPLHFESKRCVSKYKKQYFGNVIYVFCPGRLAEVVCDKLSFREARGGSMR